MNNKPLCCFTFLKMNDFYRCIPSLSAHKIYSFFVFFFPTSFVHSFIRSPFIVHLPQWSLIAYVYRARYTLHILFLHTSAEHWIVVTMKKTANECRQQSATIVSFPFIRTPTCLCNGNELKIYFEVREHLLLLNAIIGTFLAGRPNNRSTERYSIWFIFWLVKRKLIKYIEPTHHIACMGMRVFWTSTCTTCNNCILNY